MQASLLLGAGSVLAVVLVLGTGSAAPSDPTSATATSAQDPTTPPKPPAPPAADGHYVLVVEGDRNALAVTFASHKPSPWAGVPKGFGSDWQLTVRDAAGTALCSVPLDVRPFATQKEQLGQPVEVRGCIVVDSKIGMLVNVPAFATAASYEFSRRDPDGSTVALGTLDRTQLTTRLGGGK